MSVARKPTLLIYRVVCTDEEAMHWTAEDTGNLRVALSALVWVFRMRPKYREALAVALQQCQL